MTDFPTIKLQQGRDKRVFSGHPWVYSNEIVPDPALQSLPPGGLVKVEAASGKFIATATYNPKTLIAARVLSRDPAEAIDRDYFSKRVIRSLALRQAIYREPYYRVVHAEADGLPATIVDRFGDVLAVQTNSAGSDAHRDMLLDVLDSVLHPKAIVLRNDSPSRTIEGLEEAVTLARGALDGPVEIVDNGTRFAIELIDGQKTGWFYDQRDNRAFVAMLAAGLPRMLDVYSYAGGFGIQCAVSDTRSVLAIDRSEGALGLVSRAAELNGVTHKVETRKGDAFTLLEALVAAGEQYDMVVADPPAFVKSRKDLNAGLRAYAKLARLAAQLVRPGGYMFIASCSHNAGIEDFTVAVAKGLSEAKRTGRILRASGAGPDHPVDPFLPETAYLKALTLQLD